MYVCFFINRLSKLIRILTLCQANAPILRRSVKKTKLILVKILCECKGYNTRPFIREFLKEGWWRTASTGCWWSSEQSTGVWAAANAYSVQLCILIIGVTTLRQEEAVASSWFLEDVSLSLKFKPFCGLFTMICVSSDVRKGAINSWLKRTACTRYFRYAVWEMITW